MNTRVSGQCFHAIHILIKTKHIQFVNIISNGDTSNRRS